MCSSGPAYDLLPEGAYSGASKIAKCRHNREVIVRNVGYQAPPKKKKKKRGRSSKRKEDAARFLLYGVASSAAGVFLGRPRGRNVWARPNRAAVGFCQLEEPQGQPRGTDCRSPSHSASVGGTLT